MSRLALASCILTFACQVAIGDDLPVAVTPDTKQRDVQLQDILTVSLERCQVPDGGAVLPKDYAPQLKKMAVSVTGIRPNGVLEIEGRSEVLVGDEVWEQSLTGQVHRQALGADRTVSSKDIAELRIKTRTKNIIPSDADPSGVMPHPVRQVSAQSPVSSKVAVLRQKQAELAQLQQEIRQLRAETGTQQQIMVRVQMLEVSLTKLEKLGLDVSSVESRSVSANDVSDLAKASKIFNGTGVAQMPAKGETGGAQHLINVLTKNNAARILTQPTVVGLDGQAVAVQVGSEFPYPANLGSKESVEFRPVGSQVDVLPTSLGENRVRLELKLRKSNADYSQMQEINGARVPLINVSQCNTGIESEFGQSTVLSGMIEARTEAIKRGGKVEEVSNRIALVFVITPELVDASKTAQLPISELGPK